MEAAALRAARFGRAGVAGFSVGELTATGLPPASADAVVCVDAFQFAADPGRGHLARGLHQGVPDRTGAWRPW